jgi:hypothetical protein
VAPVGKLRVVAAARPRHPEEVLREHGRVWGRRG